MKILDYGLGPRETLAVVQNGWLNKRQLNHARCLAAVGSEEECERYLYQLERRVKDEIAMWRFSQ